jgi:hypothetical protein
MIGFVSIAVLAWLFQAGGGANDRAASSAADRKSVV